MEEGAEQTRCNAVLVSICSSKRPEKPRTPLAHFLGSDFVLSSDLGRGRCLHFVRRETRVGSLRGRDRWELGPALAQTDDQQGEEEGAARAPSPRLLYLSSLR